MSEAKWTNSHMISLDEIDRNKYPTLFVYWSAMRKNPKQPNLVKWMVKNKPALDKEISTWSKWWFSKANTEHRHKVWNSMPKREV
jgi:hypothetical protein